MLNLPDKLVTLNLHHGKVPLHTLATRQAVYKARYLPEQNRLYVEERTYGRVWCSCDIARDHPEFFEALREILQKRSDDTWYFLREGEFETVRDRYTQTV
jgi:hypothetical protein